MSGLENCTYVPESDVEGAFGRDGPASFGDEGLTATANAYGHLIHITRYLGGDPCDQSRFICADFAQSHQHSDSEPAPCRELPKNTSTTLQDESRLDSDRKRELNHLQLLNRMSTSPQIGSRLGTLDSADAVASSGKAPQMSFLHNRWPLFKTKVTGGCLNVQYFIHKGVVYQRYTHSVCATPEAEEPSTTTLSGPVRLLGIDFPEKHSKVPHLHAKHLCPYRPRRNKSGRSPSDTLSDDESDDESSVLDELMNTPASSESTADVQIWLFQGNHQCEFSIEQGGRSIIVHDLSWEDALSAGQLDLTVAYTLKAKSCQKAFDIPSQGLRYVKNQLANTFEAPELDPDQNLNFMILRNVEHILSVCSITMFNQDKGSAKQLGGDSDSENISPVVLTCGDMSRHRIVTQASFHAFRFLLSALKQFKESVKPEEAERVRGDYCERISAVCTGHVEWLCKQWKASTRGQSGRGEREKKEHEALFGVETALQIIKLGEFLDSVLKSAPNAANTITGLKELATSWLERLNKTRRNGLLMLSHYENTLSRFDLVDHALIWWAMTSAEKHGWNPKIDYDAFDKRKRQISTQEFQGIILKRFRTHNTTMKTRMLARSRSLLETDFILGPEDTALFYAEKCGLFTKASMSCPSAAWTDTLDCQKYSDDNEPSEWNHPLDFGLAVILCSQNRAVNSEEPAKIYKSVQSTLLRESSSSGLSIGQCSWLNESISSMDEKKHDTYWSTQFEVPYIIWAFQISKTDSKEVVSETKSKEPPPPEGNSKEPSIKTNSREIGHLANTISRLNHTLVAQNTASKGDTVMKQRLPFGDHIGVKHIVETPDKWLYDEPKFLTFQPEIPQISIENLEKEIIKKKNAFFKNAIGQVFDDQLKAVKAYKSEPRPENRITWIVSDIQRTYGSHEPKPKELEDQEIIQYPNGEQKDKWDEEDLKELRNRLNPQRRRQQSICKKRLLQFFCMQPTTALVCYLASAEGDTMVSFFSRHARYETYHLDQAVRITNKWVTELHLSFWTPGHKSDLQKDTRLPEADWANFPGSAPKNSRGPNTAKDDDPNKKIVQRAIVSFMIDGDFLDRYWTCHFIQHSNIQTHKTEHGEAASSQEHGNFDIKNELSSKSMWKQRRVLELVLFHRAINHIVISADQLLDEAKEAVKRSFPWDETEQPYSKHAILAYTIMPLRTRYNDYESASKVGHQLLYLLQALQENLSNNLTTTQEWLDREGKRERPQWTKAEESTYGDEISKWQALNDQRVFDLRQCHDRIKSYNYALTRKLEDVHRELDFRGNNGIRLFTYVTVVFLPIGFGTGLFSMSEVPSVPTLVWMIGTSAVALLVTVVALANAKVLEINVKKPIERLGCFFSFIWRWGPFGWLWSLFGWIWSLLRWLWSLLRWLWGPFSRRSALLKRRFQNASKTRTDDVQQRDSIC